VTADSIEHDDGIGGEAYSLMMRLVMGHAENSRLDAEELREHGFEPVQVVGSPTLLWRPSLGPLDGSLYTEQAALAAVRPIIGDEEG